MPGKENNEVKKSEITLKRLSIKLEDEISQDDNGNDIVLSPGTTVNIVFKDPLIIENQEEGLEVKLIL